MKIAALCVTYLRPRSLGFLIRAWLDQDFRQHGIDAELLILDDAGQYEEQAGEDWHLVSTDARYAALGEKRNAAAAMADPAPDAFAIWDDDDYYLPWAIRATAAALGYADWSRPSQVLIEKPKGSGLLHRHRTGGLFHAGMAYTREAFERTGGYPPAMNNGEDQALFALLKRSGASEADPVDLGFDPFYVYNWYGSSGGYHLSGMGPRGYQALGGRPAPRATLDLEAYPPGLDRPQILAHLRPRPF